MPSEPSPFSKSRRRLVLLFGYWPSTDIGIEGRHGMLWKWKALQENYKNSGYDVLAITPTFEYRRGWSDLGRTIPYWGKGEGHLIVDYRVTSQDFWAIAQERLPIAIMSFSRGYNDRSWEIETAGRNLEQGYWIDASLYYDDSGSRIVDSRDLPYPGGSAEDFSPFRGEGTTEGGPPDRTLPANANRESNLPILAIRDAINAEFLSPPVKLVAAIDHTGIVGNFVSEFMAYHVTWYRDYINEKFPDDPVNQCQRAGHVHVGVQVAVADAEKAIDIQLAELFKVLT